MKPVHIPPFLVSVDKPTRCCKCREIDTVNTFGRCGDCELAFQKDTLLETIASVKPMDAESNRLFLIEFQLRADELMARGK